MEPGGVKDTGAPLFSGARLSRRQPRADGVAGAYPSPGRNTMTGSAHADDVSPTILLGLDRTVDGPRVLMPRVGEGSPMQPPTDDRIASAGASVLAGFRDPDVTVAAAEIATARARGLTSLPLPLAR